jgi:uncharacterized protein (DUF952 family)
MSVIYHLVSADHWHSCDETAPYVPGDFDAEGFIHCTRGLDLVVQVANTYYGDVPGDFFLLVIDESLVSAEIKYEDGFPHVYGPLNRDAITTIRPMPRRADGHFELPT